MTSPVDKLLSDAVSAARERASADADDGAATRLRIRESLAARGGWRRKRFTLIAAVIASMFGSTAFAYWAGWRPPWSEPELAVAPAPVLDEIGAPSRAGGLRSRVEVVSEVVIDAGVEQVIAAPTPVEVPLPPRERVPAETPVVPAKPSRVDVPAETSVAPARPPRQDGPAGPSGSSGTRTVARAPVVAPTPPPPLVPPGATTRVTPPPPPLPSVATASPRTEAPRPDPELAAYRRAHQLHFKGGDPKQALAAWDDYLKEFPDGKLAPEARYDRALVLVKLARWGEARAALAPFANAPAGSYRQREAAQVLAAIRDR
ncbi:MAG: hypothetical protein AB7O24_14140 [Kofleriaceae bacterium]